MTQSKSFTDKEMEEISLTTSNFGYSAVALDALNDIGTRFTLVQAIVDVSPSTEDFITEMEAALAEIAKAAAASPEKDTFLFRAVRFATRADELHGFLPMTDCVPSRYDNSLAGAGLGGSTSLRDAIVNALEATRTEARRLGQADFDINAAVFVITDGLDNTSSLTINDVKREFKRVTQEEYCESLLPVLIGVNVGDDPTGRVINQGLEDFQADAGFAQYVRQKDASAKTLAQMAKFVSQSMSSQSQSLGTGGPSKPIDINSI